MLHQGVMARRIPGSLVTLHSPLIYREAPFFSELQLQPLAAHTDLLWTNPEEVSQINKQEGAGGMTDLSTIQQFEALHLNAERGGLYGWIVHKCLEDCVWVYVGRGFFQHLNVFMLMNLVSSTHLSSVWQSPIDCKTRE